MTPERILIADDHEVTRRGVRELLRDAFEKVTIGEAKDAQTLIEMVESGPWDLILLDIMMPGSNVIDVITEIRAIHATVPILVFTALVEVEYVMQTLKAGANGIIHKHRAADDLIDAVKKCVSGQTYLHAESAIAIADSLRESKSQGVHEKLAGRELEIFRLIAKGRAVKEIAADLGVAAKTVATYLARIREKTGLGSHVEITRYAMKNGIVE